MTLEKHDEQYHNGHYDGGICTLREKDKADDVRQVSLVEISHHFPPNFKVDDIVKVGIQSILDNGGVYGARGLTTEIGGESTVIGKKALKHGMRSYTAQFYKDIKDSDNADIIPVIGSIMKNAVLWKLEQKDASDVGKPIEFKKIFVSAVVIDGLIYPVIIVVNKNADNSTGSVIHFNSLKSFNVKRSASNSNGIKTNNQSSVSLAKLLDSIGSDPINP